MPRYTILVIAEDKLLMKLTDYHLRKEPQIGATLVLRWRKEMMANPPSGLASIEVTGLVVEIDESVTILGKKSRLPYTWEQSRYYREIPFAGS